MKTKWDYSKLADAYLERPDYSNGAISKIMETCGIKKGDAVCDIGAGTAHLTRHLAGLGLNVTAIEPNDNMRANGIQRTEGMANVTWMEAVAEETKQKNACFDLVTFGSSFNVTDRLAAMKETYRILKPGGWFTCMWNHRDLNDEIQSQIESIIQKQIPDYDYGSRREDQTETIRESGLFDNIQYIEGTVNHEMSIDACVEAWRSHGTLERQSKDKFMHIISEIKHYLFSLKVEKITIPYTTRAWVAQKIER